MAPEQLSRVTDASAELRDYVGFDRVILLDTSGDTHTYVIVDRHGSHIGLSQSAYQLLHARRTGLTFDEIAARVNQHTRGTVATGNQVEGVHRELVEKLNQIETRGARRTLPAGFWLRCRMCPRDFVSQVAATLSSLYSPSSVAAMSAFIVMSIALTAPPFSSLSLEDNAFLPAYLLFAASVIAHEFGHAAACARYGARVSDIGFAMYLVYPAFYSDVTAAWQLSRWKRIVIDLGGAYFQLVVMAVYLLAYTWTGWPPLQLAFVLIAYTLAFSLNPVLKFDGYWVVTDLLGIANLDRQPARIRSYALDRLRGRQPKPLPWSGTLLVVMVMYSVISFCVWTYFIARLVPLVWLRLLRYDQSWSRLTSPILSGALPSWTAVHAVLVSTLLLVFSGFMLWRFGQMLISPVLRGMKHALRTVGAASTAAVDR